MDALTHGSLSSSSPSLSYGYAIYIFPKDLQWFDTEPYHDYVTSPRVWEEAARG